MVQLGYKRKTWCQHIGPWFFVHMLILSIRDSTIIQPN